jgi:predicted RNA methylase
MEEKMASKRQSRRFDAPIELKRLLFDVAEPESIQLTNESVFSTSPPDQAAIVPKVVRHFMDPAKAAITDATANVGGNLSAMGCFRKVTAVEIDKTTYDMLRSNASLFGVHAHFINADYTSVYDTIQQDVVFLDPPWGGLEYYKKKDKELYLSGVPLSKMLTEKLPYAADLVVAKIPTTYPAQAVVDQQRWAFAQVIPVHAARKVLYNILVLSKRLPKKPIKPFRVKKINYRRFLKPA